MKSILIITLLAASAIAAPSRKVYPDPHPDYNGDLEVTVRETDAPLMLPGELVSIRDWDITAVHDDNGNVYIPLIKPDDFIDMKVKKILMEIENVKKSEPNGPIYLYLVSTTHDGKHKRFVYSDAALNLYIKL